MVLVTGLVLHNQNKFKEHKTHNMKNNMTHFAIHIDNMGRAKDFYSEVFGWGFNSYGGDDFLQIKNNTTENAELIGALQSRNYSPVKEKVIGFECSIGVVNLDETVQKVKSKGGIILMSKTAIPYVGWITKFLDTEGNLVCAIQYDTNAL